jgi:MFS family permease
VGAVLAGLIMTHAVERIDRRGIILLQSVFVYGVATIVFGISRNFWLTFLCLAVVGAADSVSTVLRNIIRQLSTPDHLRGRMTSINMMFFAGGRSSAAGPAWWRSRSAPFWWRRGSSHAGDRVDRRDRRA